MPRAPDPLPTQRPMMRLTIQSQLAQLRRATELVNEFSARYGLADEDSNALHVMLDEVLNNSIRHGLASESAHAIAVTLELAEGEIKVQVEDDGVAFDPTQAPVAQLGGTLEERKEGGMGLTFVRALTHRMEYRRIDGRNQLTLRRRVGGESSR